MLSLTYGLLHVPVVMSASVTHSSIREQLEFADELRRSIHLAGDCLWHQPNLCVDFTRFDGHTPLQLSRFPAS